jgi:hypothetical protein
MEGKILDHGEYRLLESERGRKLLILNGLQAFYWNKEDGVEKLWLTEGISDKSGDKHFTEQNKGAYSLIYVEDDPNYRGLPHLYLSDGNHYDEFILQGGFPNLENVFREIIATRRIIPAEEVDTFIFMHKD